MAAPFIKSDRTKDIPRQIARGLQMLLESRDLLARTRAVMIQARDGDGSQAAHYDLLATLGGYEAGDYADANAAAKASFDELDSLIYKLTTDASVSEVYAAVNQCCAKHGV